jgi:hypothetical protein
MDGDFLFDPTSEQGRSVNAPAAEFNSLCERHCIVLLGDSGLGKSDIFLKAYKAVLSANDPNQRAEFCDVADFANDTLIDQFLSSTPFAEWLLSDATLSLFIDGLDEGLMRGNGWGGILKRKLASWSQEVRTTDPTKIVPAARLRLRISCRPGLWPESLEGDLRSFFDKGRLDDAPSAISLWDLLPLRRCDVELAAADHGIDANQFMKEVIRAGATSFAARPLSLKLLIRTVEQDRRLPNTQVEMFRRGCLHLVEEHNVAHRESSIRPKVTPTRRIQIASRIAAMTIFCGKPWVERTASGEVTSYSSILSADEIRGSLSQEDISAVELSETLDSGLFSYQDAKCFRWAHQSFAAFLAAEWCGKSGLSTRDLRSLILVNGAGGSGVPQQVLWAATWLCEIKPALQSLFAKTNPALLFTLDEAAIDVRLRPALVRKVLERRLSHEQTRMLMQLGARLNHPRLVEQLRPYVRKKNRNLDQRHRALDLAVACEPVGLSGDLARVALDPAENESIRHTAAFAVSRFGTNEARRSLLPLTSGDSGDENQELKGWSLAANWPANISSIELLELLERPRHPNHYGGYFTHLHRLSVEIGAEVKDEEVPTALRWCATQRNIGEISILNDVVSAILIRAFASVNNDEVCTLLAEELISRMRVHIEPIPGGTRQHRLKEWIDLLRSRPQERSLLLRRGLEIIQPIDRYYLFEFIQMLHFESSDIQLLTNLARESPERYSQPVSALFTGMGGVPGIFDAIYQGVTGGYLDQNLSGVLIDDLDGAKAQSERAQSLRKERAAAESDERQMQLWEWFNNALNASEAGNYSNWVGLWQILWEMNSGRWEGTPRIDDSTGWKILDSAQRDRVFEAAVRFLLAPGDLIFDFLGGTTRPIWATALYSALLLVWRSHRNLLEGATDREWWVWTTVALWFPYGQDQKDWEGLMTFLSQGNPKAFIESVEFVIGQEIKGEQSLQIYSRQQFRWPIALIEILLRVVGSSETPFSAWSSCLEWGLVSFPNTFEQLIVDEVFELASEFPFEHKEKLITTCCILFSHGRGDPWKQLSEIFYMRPSLNRDFFEQVGGVPPENAFLERMSDGSLGEFYVWIAREYPEDREDLPSGFGAMGPGFTTRMLRDSAFFAMRDRGNLSVFDFVTQSFPERKWIEGHRPAAIEAALRRKWTATTPEAMLRLVAERSIPWHQSKNAFVGAIVLPFTVSIPLSVALSDIGPLWLRCFLATVVAAIVSGGLLTWFRFMRPIRSSPRNA